MNKNKLISNIIICSLFKLVDVNPPIIPIMKNPLLLAFILISLSNCTVDSNSENPPADSTYFPPIIGSEWETRSLSELNWNSTHIPALLTLLEQNNTRAFIVLKDGRIVIEEYFGYNLTETDPFTQSTNWYWASAGKTLTAFMVGLAQEEGHLDINNPTLNYLGNSWTGMSPDQEAHVTVKNQLTMTTGFDDGVPNNTNTSPENLVYLTPPNTRWAYHNAPYTLLQSVVSEATDINFDSYFSSKLRNRIGMDGFWMNLEDNRVYFSTARSAARFAHLMLNDGVWDETTIMNDPSYFDEMISSSQNLNPAYGYLWWLNGKSSYMIPQVQQVFQGSLIPNAPSDMFCGIGANGQFVCIVPSLELVLIRMGTAPDQNLLPFTFLDDIWEVLQDVVR